MHNFKHLTGLLLIGSLLGIPFVLLLMARELKPYPAVILHGAPGKVTLNESWYETSRFEVSAKDTETKQYRRLKLQEVINHIPIDFFESMAANNFGLKADHEFATFHRGRGINFSRSQKPTGNILDNGCANIWSPQIVMMSFKSFAKWPCGLTQKPRKPKI